MANPEKPELDYSYTAFQQSQGDNSFPGTQLDNDLANLKTAVDEVIDFAVGVIREDGKLQNGIVGKNALGEDILLGLPAPRPWATGHSYALDDTATINNSLYLCLEGHTSGATFAADLSAGLWVLLIEFTVPASILDDSVSTAKIQNGAVATAKLADLAVTTAKMASASVTLSKLAANVGVIPVGGTLEWDGPFAPAGWLLKNGQAVSRSTYLALLDVIAPTFTAAVSSGSNTLTGLTVDLRNLGLEGVKVEGSGIPSGATIVSFTATTATLSSGAVSSGASVLCRVFPHGNGDGGTTFNIPDDRDRAAVGRGNMGGTAASRISTSGAGTPGLDSAKLGAGGGVDRHTLTGAQLASHTHSATSVVTDPGHTHTIATSNENIRSDFTSSTVEAFNGGTSTTAGVGDGEVTASRVTGVTVATSVGDYGGGEAHPNLPPVRVTNKIIFAGV